MIYKNNNWVESYNKKSKSYYKIDREFDRESTHTQGSLGYH